MEKSKMIKLINFFNNIEIIEEDVTTPVEKANGQFVLIVTYIYGEKKFTTNKLYYNDISTNIEKKNIVDYFGAPVYWLDMDIHGWPSKNANLDEKIIKEIASSDDIEFQDFLMELANDSKDGYIFQIIQRDGYWPNYHFNLLNNNHWHDIIKLIKEFIRSKGEEINKSYFSRLVFRWEQNKLDDKRSSLSPFFSGRRFITEFQKNIKMVQQDLQKQEIKVLLENNYQIILQGPPGTGKTRLAKELAFMLIKDELLPVDEKERDIKIKELSCSLQYKLIQFHPSYSYEDFIRGITAKVVGERISYEVENRVLAEIADLACNDKKPYVMIIDEINRANLPSVLGELIYALEYRGEEVDSMYVLKKGDKESRKIKLPDNLYIIGTMNTADRSVGNIDYALRRRFIFKSVLPDESVIIDTEGKVKFNEVRNIFCKYISSDFDIDDVMIGHSYFLGDFKNKINNQVKPLLMEYLKDGIFMGDYNDIKNEINIL